MDASLNKRKKTIFKLGKFHIEVIEEDSNKRTEFSKTAICRNPD